ncbi:hypothetical protein [Myroides sp. TSA_177.3]|uniref:hypothetical protein n=1 Tax=Myroides sp. TSA_177.3 TaxID=3415650 RepID=UPI0040453462
MKRICFIMVVLLYSCTPKKELSYNRYYERNGNKLLLLDKDSTFVLQDVFHFVSNGLIMGKYQLNKKGKLCIYDLIDRMNLPNVFDEANDQAENNIFVHTEVNKVTYENIDVYVKKNDIETLLGNLQGGDTSFNYPFGIGDTLQFVFKYERDGGLVVKLKHDVAATKRIVIDSPNKKITIDFDMFYFDLKNSNEVEKKCFTIRKKRFY